MTGQCDPRIELDRPVERGEVVAERIGTARRPEPDRRRDAAEQMVGGDEHAVANETQLAIGVAGRGDELPAVDAAPRPRRGAGRAGIGRTAGRWIPGPRAPRSRRPARLEDGTSRRAAPTRPGSPRRARTARSRALPGRRGRPSTRADPPLPRRGPDGSGSRIRVATPPACLRELERPATPCASGSPIPVSTIVQPSSPGRRYVCTCPGRVGSGSVTRRIPSPSSSMARDSRALPRSNICSILGRCGSSTGSNRAGRR